MLWTCDPQWIIPQSPKNIYRQFVGYRRSRQPAMVQNPLWYKLQRVSLELCLQISTTIRKMHRLKHSITLFWHTGSYRPQVKNQNQKVPQRNVTLIVCRRFLTLRLVGGAIELTKCFGAGRMLRSVVLWPNFSV